jgi:hypothetical protein
MGILAAITILAAAATGNAAPQANYLQTVAIIVGVVSGVSGLVLGILNYLHQRDTSRPRIVVRPVVFGAPPTVDWHGIMHVGNVGHVPVVLTRLGFQSARRGGHDIVLRETTSMTEVDNEPLEEVKPQHAALVLFKIEEVPQVTDVGCAYVQTMVGDTFKASRRDMRRFVKRLKEARLSQALPATPCTSSPTSQSHGEAPGPAANTASNP